MSFCILVSHRQQETSRKRQQGQRAVWLGSWSREWIAHGYFATPSETGLSKLEVLIGFPHKSGSNDSKSNGPLPGTISSKEL